MSEDSNLAQNALFPIREVARMTGVNPITIRAWERRYNLVEPIRTESGHRLYTQEDIDRLNQVTELTQQGIPVSQVKPLLKAPSEPVNLQVVTEKDVRGLLSEALNGANLERSNQLLDRLFADFPEAFWRSVLFTLNQQHKHTEAANDPANNASLTPYSTLWQSLLVPRLNARLHQTLQVLPAPVRPLWVESTTATSNITSLLVALYLANQGYYPLLHAETSGDLERVHEYLQTYKCHGLVIVDDADEFDASFFRPWQESHPSYEIKLFLSRPMTELGQAMQVRHYDLNETFAS